MVLPFDDGPGRELVGFTERILAVAVGPQGRLVAAGSARKEPFVRVWDLESGAMRLLDAGDGKNAGYLEFTGDGDLWVGNGTPMLRRWSLGGTQPRIQEEIGLESLESDGAQLCGINLQNRQVLFRQDDKLWIQNIDTDKSRELTSHSLPETCSWQNNGKIIVSTDGRGGIRVGTAAGDDAHLLTGYEYGDVVVSPDGRWVASGGLDNEIRLWPMPDLSKPPLHTLPRSELIAKLKTLTNLRAVRDEDSPTGWKIDVGPFPGWETVPTW